MVYVVQVKDGEQWQPVVMAGLPLLLCEGEMIPPHIQGETRCIPVNELNEEEYA
jgi:hypothetical protein